MLRIASLYSRKAAALSRAGSNASLRHFSPTALLLDDDAAALKRKDAAAEYNNRRAAYKKEVAILRKDYASEVALQRAADAAEKLAEQKEIRRGKLERQRVKNMRSAQRSMRELEKRRLRELEFQEELRVAQDNRDDRKERFRKARQMVVDELEEEAPLWLTTPEEVEAAFTSGSEQDLWAFPNGIVGAPSPTEDADYWNYESHTWHLQKTYRTQREALAEEMNEKIYNESNIDKAYWTKERLEKRRKLEEKAKLRAMVLDAGRRTLLMKQKELIQDTFPKRDRDDPMSRIPRPMPVPNVKILANEGVLEQEGAQALLKDPTQFFEFNKEVADTMGAEDGEYDGPTLGVPIGLKNDIKIEKTLDKAYPDVLGKMPRPDTRSAKEKKREERERAMLAAAKSKDDGEIDLDSDDADDMSDFEEIDLDKIDLDGDTEWEGDDKSSLPRRERYSEDDIDAMIERLEKKVVHLEEELDYELDLAQQQQAAGMEGGQEEVKSTVVEDDSGTKFTIEAGDQVFDVGDLGVEPDEVEKILLGLTDDQVLALHAIESAGEGILGAEELREKLAEVPGLTDEQIDAMVRIEGALASNETLAAEREGDKK